MALGEYGEKALPPSVRGPLVRKLLQWYRDDPDAGIHGAIDWLLRHGKEGPLGRPLEWQDNVYPSRWRLMGNERTYDWIGPDGPGLP